MNFYKMFEEALPIIKNFAPSFAAAIGGHVGLAINLLAAAFNTSPKDVNQLVKTIMEDDDAQKKLETLEEQYSDALKHLMIALSCLESAKISLKVTFKDLN